MLRMIIINTEWRGSAEYKQQRGFVAEEVAKAKALGQYTAVGTSSSTLYRRRSRL